MADGLMKKTDKFAEQLWDVYHNLSIFSLLLLLFYTVLVPADLSQRAKSATADGLSLGPNIFRLNWLKAFMIDQKVQEI
jgi:hypothetical protein